MSEKEKYCAAELEVVFIKSYDVISTSAIGEEGLDKGAWA